MRDYLFVYATLKSKWLREHIISEDVPMESDSLSGYKEVFVGKEKWATLKKTLPSRKVHGEVLEVTREELRKFDNYESSVYTRIRVTLDSGRVAWVYIMKQRDWGNFSFSPNVMMQYIPEISRARNTQWAR